MSREFFFELLTEEIPAWMLPARLEVLRSALGDFVRGFSGEAPESGSILVDATSRRIFFVLRDLPPRQPSRVEETKGPATKIAFEANGEPSNALKGFLRKNSATMEDVQTEGDYVWIRRTAEGETIESALARAVPQIVEGLRWPKMMYWGGERTFIRPVHSLIALLDGQPLAMRAFGLDASNVTAGHRTLGTASITVSGWDDYREKLQRDHVIISADERVSKMRADAARLSSEVGGEPAADESIWEQWKYLTEAPMLVRPEFDERFLSLPEEVLITVMRVHQKQLPIRKGGELSNSFLAIVDQISDEEGNARSGNRFVTNARFADAQFFYETDRKQRLSERVEPLSRLQFQEKLGSYQDKSRRVAEIAERIRTESRSKIAAAALSTAASLAKADLATEMVKEFTELQGKIGGIYAREEGLPDEVWMAIYDHYLPQSVDDALPRSEAGAILSIADKLDTLSGFFSVGLQPSGSKDPFALRRSAQGIVQILLEISSWQIAIPIDRLVEFGLDAHRVSQEQRDPLRSALLDFFAERVRTLLQGTLRSFAYDEIAAAMAAGWFFPADLADRIEAVRSARGGKDFLSLLDSAKRIQNIIQKGDAAVAVRSDLLQLPAEQRLHSLHELVSEQIDELVSARRYADALESFAALAPELETFFDDVMVMVEDAALRANRIALLRAVGGMVAKVADVTQIVVDRSSYDSSAS